MKIGENIKEVREKERKLNKDFVAKALGITTKAYSNIESNKSDITLTRLFEIADILECSPEYLLNYQDKQTFSNHFNNYEGNRGVNIMYQGCTSDHVKNLENALKDSKRKHQDLEASIRTKNN
ncbi:hypothetical protein APR41_16060 [Salegentibacter salinarum]|uniref:HTH cro/C1-type domain-containing protein n=1 Tax=Salegentibacter salinarum TaxID=447422 RepID=A0A2N0TXK9_9FLAO|nr:helix-turn-helix domain-containing protein [Salegentibacter salinarum]PKD19474.1 hypothetical protein APR41_16060 [Salegentibacter salinarum]SKB91889.1 Helix-turn-helix [Salegentibacter salinarum]